MRQKNFLFCTLCLAVGMLTSCIGSDNEWDSNYVIPIEPPYEPMFQFDEEGVPCRLNSPTLSQDMQRDVQKEAIGYGWKWMLTFEIQDDGFVKSEDFYKSMFGASPTSYYIKSDRDLVRYFWSDAIGGPTYRAQRFSINTKTGVLTDEDNQSDPWTTILRIWSIYKVNGRWYMDTVEPLCIRSDKNGEYKLVWGWSHYYRMSKDELRAMQDEHTN